MAEFLEAYNKTQDNEGLILTDTPGDAGGLSYGAISSRANPTWPGFAIIKEQNLQVGHSLPELLPLYKQFIYTNYWQRIGGDAIQDQDLADQVFDMAINAGVGEALLLLKQS